MPTDKRSEAQCEFDAAKHGWAFASGNQLSLRIQRCEKIAKELDLSDPRHEILASMRSTLESERRH
jgi:hypothetical protein